MAKKTKGKGPHQIKEEVPDPPAEWNGTNVKELRVARGLTVAELAEKADLSNGQVSDIENGTGGFSAESLYKLARALGVSRAALLPRDPWDLISDQFWPIWERADPTQRDQIVTITKTIVVPPKPKR